MIPASEADVLMMTVNDAIDCAAEGEVANGYTSLLAGLERAREIAEEGLPWAPELVGRWETAVENYCTCYGVKMT